MASSRYLVVVIPKTNTTSQVQMQARSLVPAERIKVQWVSAQGAEEAVEMVTVPHGARVFCAPANAVRSFVRPEIAPLVEEGCSRG